MSDAPGPSPESPGTDKNAILELAREAIGYEQGLWRTFVDLRYKPKDVLDGYLQGDRKYVSPFKLLTTTLSLWIVINGFLVDWYAIWNDLISATMSQEVRFIAYLKDFDEAGRVALEKKVIDKALPFTSIVVRIAGDLFSKWYVPFAILAVILGSWLFNRRQGKQPGGLKRAMSILSYSVGANIPLYLVVSIVLSLNLWLGITIILLALPLTLAGKSNLISYAPVSRFFDDGGRQKEKQLLTSTFVVVLLLQIMMGTGYFLYFNYWQ